MLNDMRLVSHSSFHVWYYELFVAYVRFVAFNVKLNEIYKKMNFILRLKFLSVYFISKSGK